MPKLVAARRGSATRWARPSSHGRGCACCSQQRDRSGRLARQPQNRIPGPGIEAKAERLELIQEGADGPDPRSPAFLASSSNPRVPSTGIPSETATRRAKASSSRTRGELDSSASARTWVSPGPRSVTRGSAARLPDLRTSTPWQSRASGRGSTPGYTRPGTAPSLWQGRRTLPRIGRDTRREPLPVLLASRSQPRSRVGSSAPAGRRGHPAAIHGAPCNLETCQFEPRPLSDPASTCGRRLPLPSSAAPPASAREGRAPRVPVSGVVQKGGLPGHNPEQKRCPWCRQRQAHHGDTETRKGWRVVEVALGFRACSLASFFSVPQCLRGESSRRRDVAEARAVATRL
jgi:hypothetical protein